VANEIVPLEGFTRTCSIEFTSTNTIHYVNYTIVLQNGARVLLAYSAFERAQQVFFANSTYNVSAEAFKWSVIISDWPFQNPNNKWTAIFLISSSDPISNVTQDPDNDEISRGAIVTTGNTTLKYSFFAKALADGKIVPVPAKHLANPLDFLSNTLKSVSFIVYFPSFGVLEYDPGERN
jgi:hypothetical protein